MSNVEAFKRIFIVDKNGKIRYDSGLIPSNSYVIAFLEHLYGAFNNVNVDIEDTNNSVKSVNKPTFNSVSRDIIDAPDDNATYGIVVGTDDTAETNTDYALVAQIAHGTGAGQLDYGAHSFTAPAVVSGNVDLVVSRSFYNGSGNTITVKEIGIYCKSDCTTESPSFCILRDVLAVPTDVTDAETITVQYTLRTTV